MTPLPALRATLSQGRGEKRAPLPALRATLSQGRGEKRAPLPWERVANEVSRERGFY